MESQPLTRNSSQNSETSTTSKKSKNKKVKISIEDENIHKCSHLCVEHYPIHHAARRGDFHKLKTLLDDPLCSQCPLKPDECLGRTPLHYACATGKIKQFS